MDALRKPPRRARPHGESKLDEICTTYLSLRIVRSSWNRFIARFAEYADAVIDEAADHAAGRDVFAPSWIMLRRIRKSTIGCYLSSVLTFPKGHRTPCDQITPFTWLSNCLDFRTVVYCLTTYCT